MKRNKQQYTFIDLFAGLGGFHIAMQELGCKCVFASELKDDLRKLYEENYPGTRIEGDITKIAPSDIPPHDILCAGFPCQPFSQAGKQQGFNDDKQRGNLFDYICAIVQYHRPKYIFLGEFYQFNLSSCIRQQNSLTAQFVSFSLSNLANIFYPPPIFTIINLCLL